jgi:hypothetical protein
MAQMKPKFFLVSLLAVVFCSCAGTASFRESAPLPEGEISQLAGQIEDIVLNTELGDPIVRDGESEIVEIDPAGTMIGMGEIQQKAPALAKLNVANETMLMAIRGRVLRRSAVLDFERNGCVGENRRALLQYLRSEWCPDDRDMRSRAGFAVLEENRDRRIIYEQIIEANGLGSSAADRIREIFAEEIHKRAWANTPLEMPDGTWKRR